MRISPRRIYYRPRNNLDRSDCNLISITISKTGPHLDKVIPKCLIIYARSMAKPDAHAASALHSEVSINYIDICFSCDL